MTNKASFADLAKLITDLSRDLPIQKRLQRLLDVFQRNFPCDAIALLERQGGQLVPKAVRGLSTDIFGRRFVIREHPRLAQILDSRRPVRFPADSALPDPYDGLVESHAKHLHVHDCIGAALRVDNIPWGVITLDALNPQAFDTFDLEVLETFLDMAAATVRASFWIHRLEERLERHQRIALTEEPYGMSAEIIGTSTSKARLMHEAETVAASDLTVLVLGETGVGKELFVHHIHRHSSRASEPMVHLNCAALPEALAESELFGHTKGAFSGADSARAGKFELAHEATLFLDEVGELPLALQAKFLRALQNGEVQRVGSDEYHKVDVRLIAATNRDLKKEVAAGRFRADLYHRLSVYPLLIPPLRERREDILPLAGYFLQRDQRRLGLRGVSLSRDAKTQLSNRNWPGNIRELEHTLSRGIIRAITSGHNDDSIIQLNSGHLDTEPNVAGESIESPAISDFKLPLKDSVDSFKRRLIQARLLECKNNKAATARSLGIDRGNFSRLLRKMDIE